MPNQTPSVRSAANPVPLIDLLEWRSQGNSFDEWRLGRFVQRVYRSGCSADIYAANSDVNLRIQLSSFA